MDDAYIPNHEAVLKIPIDTANIREELNFYKLLRDIFKEYDKNTEDLDFIIKNMEDQIIEFNVSEPVLPNEDKIIAVIEKHPYFKNPCDYPIRLLTLLKYLRKKGLNVNYADIDIYMDKIIQRMDGVKKVGRGLYQKKL